MDTPAIRQAKAEIGQLLKKSHSLLERRSFDQAVAAINDALKRLGRSQLALLPEGHLIKVKLLTNMGAARLGMHQP